MAQLFPILNVPTIAEACTQSWETMPGTARVRHCASCDQDVVNLAAMSSAEIARLLQGPLPCLRIARNSDGSLVTTEPPARRSLPRIAAGVLTAAMAFSAAAQTDSHSQRATMGVPPLAPQPYVTGRVTDHAGHPIPQTTATLLHQGKAVATLKLGPDGIYNFAAPAGLYQLHIEAPNAVTTNVTVKLSPERPLTLPIELSQQGATIGRINPLPNITMGLMARPPKAAATKIVQPSRPPGRDLKPID